MARAGLGDGWDCLFANDFDHKKGMTYQLNWGTGGELHVGDVRQVKPGQLPGNTDLAWASFPCQDLSLAGGGAGLKGERSGTFYPFWDAMNALIDDGRGPKIIALENVAGTLTSHAGNDFIAICETYRHKDYRFGGMVIDASMFVPQSRPRLFVVGVRGDVPISDNLVSPGPLAPFHTRSRRNAYDRLPQSTKEEWLWWNLPAPARRHLSFADLVEENPVSTDWHTPAETEALLAMMTPVNTAKVEAAKRAGRKMVGAVYKRTRVGPDGKKVRAEVRFDEVAGCLRTPAGGSSRQTILVVESDRVRSRLLCTREAARLMGLPEHYKLPKAYNEAYHLVGDGVAVPVVRYLAQHLFEPILSGDSESHGEGTEQRGDKKASVGNG